MLCVFVFAEPNHNHNKQDIHKVSAFIRAHSCLINQVLVHILGAGQSGVGATI